ncbi:MULTISPECIES: extracellular solute-binding protein [unclassified Moraxella]|uniref:extracellular solute-binding protein n=1 Tax=unclassified Moraxella TaxID=2685852 RepID=UPI003AF6ABB9
MGGWVLAKFDGQYTNNNKINDICIGLLLMLTGGLTACSQSNDTPATTQDTSQTSASQPSMTSVSTPTPATIASSVHTASVPQTITHQINLYTSIDKKALTPLLADFTKKTDIKVVVTQDEPMSLLARLKAEGENSPADMLLTEDVGVFHHAVEEGLLQAFSSDKSVANVPERYRDPNGNWLALSYYARTAVYDSRMLINKDIISYADFAKAKWFQKLCISQASYIPNQALAVNLIDNLGEKKATEVLKGWLANVAVAPVLDDNAVMQAIEKGQCQVGIVNSHHYGDYLQAHPTTPIKLTWLNKGYGGLHTNITGVAIPKHTKHPETTLALIEWLAQKPQQALYASLSKTFPMDKNTEASVLLKSWGDFEINPMPVNDYAEKQKMAVDLLKDISYP